MLINFQFPELEADAEVERQRKERERQQKQHVLTLSETREQIGQMESRLSELKEEKHQLFLQLKKVLNEDETRRRQLMNQEAAELMKLHPFNNFNSPPRLQLSDHGGHHPQQIFMQPMTVTRTQTGPGVYKVGQPVSVSHHNNNNPSPHATMPVTVCSIFPTLFRHGCFIISMIHRDRLRGQEVHHHLHNHIITSLDLSNHLLKLFLNMG